MASNVTLDRAVFKEALRRVAGDPEFGREFEERPGSALKSIGLDLPEEAQRILDSKPLSKTLQSAFGSDASRLRGGEDVGILPLVAVEVAISVAVAVATGSDVSGEPPASELEPARGPRRETPSAARREGTLDSAIDRMIAAARIKVKE
jgi:hypothetical protein